MRKDLEMNKITTKYLKQVAGHIHMIKLQINYSNSNRIKKRKWKITIMLNGVIKNI